MKLFEVFVSICLSLGCCLYIQPQGTKSKTWIPAIYHGLTVGTSTRKDVARVLGKPKWVGKEEDTGLPISSYTVSDPVPGTLVVYTKRDLLDGMMLYPKDTLKQSDIVRILGTDYTVVRYDTDECLTESGTSPLYEAMNGSLRQVEYRQRGLAVILRDAETTNSEVEAIGFVDKPFGPTHSRCTGERKRKWGKGGKG
jgi:hypothetical protein